MPRITRAGDQGGFRYDLASMRPGRNAPDNAEVDASVIVEIFASMRPGRNAPDNGIVRFADPRAAFASMRPGRNAPDNSRWTRRLWRRWRRFNEAGAKCPG